MGLEIQPVARPEVFAHVSRNTNQGSIVDGAWTLVLYNAEVADALGFHSTVSNTGRMLPNVAGTYIFIAQVELEVESANGYRGLAITKNSAGTLTAGNRIASVQAILAITGNNTMIQVVSPPVAMNGSTDYCESYAIADITSGTVPDIVGDADPRTWFACYRIG